MPFPAADSRRRRGSGAAFLRSPVMNDRPDNASVAALLRKWAARLPLSKAERASVAAYLPKPPTAALRASTAEAYPRSMTFYGEFYKVTPRTLRDWVSAGRWVDKERGIARTPPDLPPLDQPAEMAAWWPRCMKHRVPEALHALARPPTAAQAPENRPAGDGGPVPAPMDGGTLGKAPPPALPSGLVDGSGFEAALSRARENEQLAATKLREAMLATPPDAGEINLRQLAWDRAFDSLRLAEKDAEKILIAAGELVRWDEVESEEGEVLGVLNQTVRSLLVRVATKVPLASELFQKLEAAFQKEIDAAFGALEANGYTAVPPMPPENLKLAA